MSFQGDCVGSPLFCEGQLVYARNAQKALRMDIYNFNPMYGRPVSVYWRGDEVVVKTDKNRSFLIINRGTIKDM